MAAFGFSTYKMGFDKAFDFRGRSSGFELVTFYGYSILWMLILLGIQDYGWKIIPEITGIRNEFVIQKYWNYPFVIIGLVLFFPGYSLAVRRLHDTGKSGWNLLILLIPAVGMAILLYMLFSRGEPVSNRWGDPL